MENVVTGGDLPQPQVSVEPPPVQAEPDLPTQLQQLSKSKPLTVVTFGSAHFTEVSAGLAIAEEPARSTEIPKDGLFARFIKPTFVTQVTAEFAVLEHAFQLMFRDATGANVAEPMRPDGNVLSARVDRFVSWIGISPKGWKPSRKTKDRLGRIVPRGYQIESLLDVQDSTRTWSGDFRRFEELGDRVISKTRTALEELKASKEQDARRQAADNQERANVEAGHRERVTSLEKEIEAKKEEKKQLEAQLAPTKAEIEKFKREIESLSTSQDATSKTFQEIQTKTDAAKRDLETRRLEAERLTAETATAEMKLARLKTDISLFAVDMKAYGLLGFITAGAYTLIAGALMYLVFRVAMRAFGETDEIWAAYMRYPGMMSSSVLFWLKLGPILLLGAVLTGATQAIWLLLRRAIDVFDSKLRFSEISMLAKSAVDTVTAGLSHSKEERHAIFLATRLRLITHFVTERVRVQAGSKSKKIPSAAPSSSEFGELMNLTKNLLGKEEKEAE